MCASRRRLCRPKLGPILTACAGIALQVWKDVRADPEKEKDSSTGGINGQTQDSALPRTERQPIDEDLPAMGQFYCERLAAHPSPREAPRPCSRLFNDNRRMRQAPRPVSTSSTSVPWMTTRSRASTRCASSSSRAPRRTARSRTRLRPQLSCTYRVYWTGLSPSLCWDGHPGPPAVARQDGLPVQCPGSAGCRRVAGLGTCVLSRE